MSTKSISMCEGKGSLSHNNREFSAKNIDSSRTPNNVVFVQQALSDAYHQLFDEAVEKYNANQKRTTLNTCSTACRARALSQVQTSTKVSMNTLSI